MKKKILSVMFASFALSLTACKFVNPTPGGGGSGGGGDSGDTYVDPNLDPITKPTSGQTTIKIVALNDFHGQVEENGNEIGLAKIATYFRSEAEKPNTLIIDQGDTWQGSIYSNYNYGNMITDVFSYSRVHAKTVGNHDFDWGLDKIKANTARSYDGYTIPTLAANVYDYNFAYKSEGSIQQTDIGRTTVAYTLKNGLKVGIVGVIGQNQITSITSKYIQDICFKEHVSIIKSEATKLKQQGCDVVIASVHTGQADVLDKDLSSYVDLVLCGHTHRYETSYENNVAFCQFACNGTNIGNINLTYDYGSNSVVNTTIETLTSSNFKNYKVNSKIQTIIDDYKTETTQLANQVLASNVSGSFPKSDEAVNLVCRAIYDQAVSENHGDVVLIMANQGRADLPSNRWKYENIYECFPFDNIVEIINVKGSDIRNEIGFSSTSVYINPSFTGTINSNQYYKIGVLDYMAYHTNTSRYYNYFPSFDGNPLAELSKNYRIILKDWLIKNNYHVGNLLKASDYSDSIDCFNGNRIL